MRAGAVSSASASNHSTLNSNASSRRNTTWFVSADGQKEQAIFIEKSEKSVAAVDESRHVPLTVIRSPFTR